MTRLWRGLALSPGLMALLLGGLAIRLVTAYALFPSSGYLFDIRSFGRFLTAPGVATDSITALPFGQSFRTAPFIAARSATQQD